MKTETSTPLSGRNDHGLRDGEGACHVRVAGAGVPADAGGAQRRNWQWNGQVDPGRLDWFTSAAPPGGGRQVQIRRCARSTPTEAVDLDPGAATLLLAVLGEVARAGPAATCHAARQAVLRGFWQMLKERGPA